MALDAISSVSLAMRGKPMTQKHTVSREEACLWVQRRCAAAGEPETPSREELLDALTIVENALLDEP
jgi:hypothetical protein